MAISNTNATTEWRAKWFSANLQAVLHASLVAEKVCDVNRSEEFYIWNPYAAAPTTTVQTIAGTYTPAAYTTANDTLTVTDEFICSNMIHDYEFAMARQGLYQSVMDEMTASVATAIDKWVINYLCDAGTGAYDTPTGGFTTAANIPVIMSNLISKVAGYSEVYKGLYLIIENTDVPGFIQSGASSGFNFADSWLNNGFMTSYMGVDIYVIRSGTFSSSTIGTKTFTNSGHRVFGVKGTTTFAFPRGIHYEEKMITSETGKELVCMGYVGFAAWNNKKTLTVDITIK